jgi:hypothetical protein
VREALQAQVPLPLEEIIALRKKSRQAIRLFKATFWVAIIIFNLVLWVPLPFALSTAALVTICAICLLVAFVPPILGIREHQRRLDLLQESSAGPKRGLVGSAGRSYLDQVKEEGRLLIKAEVEILEERNSAGASESN